MIEQSNERSLLVMCSRTKEDEDKVTCQKKERKTKQKKTTATETRPNT